jgi:inorganic pyrophosphatase/exopolyphosphatase
VNPLTDYDPIGGHTKEEADAEYDKLFRELHGCGAEEAPQPGFAVYVLTPKNPGLDAVCAVVAYAGLRNALEGAERHIPVISGLADAQTSSLFARFGVALPQRIEDFIDNTCEAASGQLKPAEVIMVGHNDSASAFDGLNSCRILEIIDCHGLGGLITEYPLYCLIRPTGAVSTIIYKLYLESELVPDEALAKLLCAGIVSATDGFVTPETTRSDKISAAELAVRAGIDLEELLLQARCSCMM